MIDIIVLSLLRDSLRGCIGKDEGKTEEREHTEYWVHLSPCSLTSHLSHSLLLPLHPSIPVSPPPLPPYRFFHLFVSSSLFPCSIIIHFHFQFLFSLPFILLLVSTVHLPFRCPALMLPIPFPPFFSLLSILLSPSSSSLLQLISPLWWL